VLGALGGALLAFAILQPIKVLPRIRVAPGYALVDQSGVSITSEDQRGAVTLYTFVPLGCGERCVAINETMAEVRDRVGVEADLGGVPFEMVTVVLADDPSPAEVAAASSSAGADGEDWRWVSGDWAAIKTLVGTGFQRYFEEGDDGEIAFDVGYVLVDGNGVIRGAYRFQTLSTEADKLVGHVGMLGDEIRYSTGAGGWAYEAAHLFSCYG